MRALVVLLLVAPLAGCTWGDEAPPTPTTGATPTGPEYPPLTFRGRVTDVVTGDPVPGATVRLDLAHTEPCRQQRLGWASWSLPVAEDGTFGPFDLPAPDSPTQRFFLHATAEGYAPDVTYIGPENAFIARDLAVRLHPEAAVEGRAPPGTVAALDAPLFPRLAVADAEGRYRFEHSRAEERSLVVATSVPHRARVTPPATVDAEESNETGWSLRGQVRLASGAPRAADVVAWNGTELWSAARTDEVGRFLLPLPAIPVAGLRIAARTADAAYEGILVRDVEGPPAVMETILLRPAC